MLGCCVSSIDGIRVGIGGSLGRWVVFEFGGILNWFGSLLSWVVIVCVSCVCCVWMLLS